MGAVLFDAVPGSYSAVGAMSRARWTKNPEGRSGAYQPCTLLCGVLDECMWVIGNPLASTLAVISGLLAFSFTGMCVVVGALMFLTELTTGATVTDSAGPR